MPTLRDEVQAFLDDYQAAINANDLDAIGALYGEAFLFGAPQGAQPVKRNDFLRVIPKRREYFQTLGLTSSRIIGFDATPVSDHYVSATVSWILPFDRAAGPPIACVATYILHRLDGRLVIVAQLDHQDLAAAVQARIT
jgi:hypothetical protein